MTNNNGLEQEAGNHFPPIPSSIPAKPSSVSSTYVVDWMSRLRLVLFPYGKDTYPGRIRGFAKLLGITPYYARYLCKPSGSKRLSLPLARRAEKICADLISELMVIKEGLELERKRLEARPKRTGMFKVQVRDATGIPKTGLWRDGWRRK